MCVCVLWKDADMCGGEGKGSSIPRNYIVLASESVLFTFCVCIRGWIPDPSPRRPNCLAIYSVVIVIFQVLLIYISGRYDSNKLNN